MDTTAIAIAVIVAAVLLILLVRRKGPRRIGLDPRRSETARPRMARAEVSLSAADLAEVADLKARGRKIEAIKLVRERAGLGLKEAKEFVEHQDFGTAQRTGNPWGR